jgi:two-component system response regulator WspF
MKIAIVNDTLMAVEALKRVVLSTSEHEIAWIAYNGKEAVQLAQNNTPDLILMDLLMPVMDGVEATRQIMQNSPCAILVVTATISGHSGKVFEAMGAGAVDAVNTPVLVPFHAADGAQDLLHKINIIGKLTNPKAKYTERNQNNVAEVSTPITNNSQLLAIGASTGGPSALASILGELPTNFPAPIVVVQHVDEQFVAGLADWLNDQISLPVRLANHGDKLEPGTVLLSNSGQHIQLSRSGTLLYCDEPKEYPYKPSANVLFESVAKNWLGQAIGLLLTGMGRDGAVGLLAMHDKGFETIAQDKESCAVFGMPKAAIALNAAKQILPLDKIASSICDYYTQKNLMGAAGNE